MTLRRTLLACMAALALPLAACGDRAEDAKTDGAAAGGVLNLYTARHYDGDLQVYAAFEKATGIKVNRIEGNPDQLIARMQAEGDASPADVFVAADAGALWRAQNAGLLQPVTSEALTAALPANLREPGGHFFGLNRRARVVAYDSTKVRPEEVDTYEELASPRFRGKLCVRSADSVYNLSLVGALLEAWGPQKTRQWVEGVVANMARPPEGGDRDQIRAVGAGVCEVAITNSYYFIRMDRSTDAADVALTEKVRLGFPSLDGQGAHVNVSGAGVAKNAPNRAAAIAFLEFLATPEAQIMNSELNNEFPGAKGVQAPAGVREFEGFAAHPMNVSAYGRRQSEAQSIMTAAGWR
jgi:iron(III) transport system substrate-binding protein